MLRVIKMNAAYKVYEPAKRAWLRKQATQIVAQLPDDEDEALYILECAKHLVTEYLNAAAPELRAVDD